MTEINKLNAVKIGIILNSTRRSAEPKCVDRFLLQTTAEVMTVIWNAIERGSVKVKNCTEKYSISASHELVEDGTNKANLHKTELNWTSHRKLIES